jgi:hypothetical protein
MVIFINTGHISDISHIQRVMLSQIYIALYLVFTQISVRALGNAIDVPVWVQRQTVDLKICMLDRLYQDTIVVNNR